jgi:hypothetical protein
MGRRPDCNRFFHELNVLTGWAQRRAKVGKRPREAINMTLFWRGAQLIVLCCLVYLMGILVH